MNKDTVFETEEYRIALLLRHVDLSITKARRNELEYLNVTPPQMGILHFAQEDDTPCTVLKLRQTMLHSNSSLVAVLNRMEKKGLIERQPDPRSKKFTRIVVTEKGQNTYRKAMNLSAFNTIISSLPVKDRQVLKEYLNVLQKAADELVKSQRGAGMDPDMELYTP
jgi:DNA-binding MarR family transcriptional regulator